MPCTRDELGKIVRDEWVKFAKLDPNSPPHHLVEWDELDEKNKEVDRRIGEAIVQHVVDKIRLFQRSDISEHNQDHRGGCQGHA